MTGEPVTTTIDFVSAEHAIRRDSQREAVVFQPGNGDAGAARFVAGLISWRHGTCRCLFRFFGHLRKVFLRQDQETMIQQAEGLKHNPRLMLIDDADRPAKWYFALKQNLLEERRTGVPVAHPMNGPVTLHWKS